MKAVVLDVSLTMEWFSGSASRVALGKRSLLDDRVAVVPQLWRYEVMNVLATWRRRGDISGAKGTRILNNVLKLPFAVVDEGSPEAVLELANTHALTAYDAAYLRVAMVTGEPLATLDKSLIRAASAVGVECV